MAEAIISNPAFANNPISTTLVGRAADGAIMSTGGETVINVQASAAIAKGEVVAWTTPTAGTPVQCVKMPTAADPRLAIGIAREAVASGGTAQIVTNGVCEVFVNAQTVAFGDNVFVPGTNAGEATCNATDPDATTIVGRLLGVVLAAKIAGTNLALAYIKQV